MDDFSQDITTFLKEKIQHVNKEYGLFFDELKSKFEKEKLAYCFKFILENSSDTNFLNQTIREINKTRFKENLPCLIDFILTHHKEEAFLDLKVLAIKTISNYKDTSAVSALLYCLNDKNSNYKIRFASAEALGKIGDKNAFDSLTNIVCDEKEKSTYIKESAVVALGMLGDDRALEVFSSIINTKQMFLDKFSYLKERIVEAISKFDISKDEKALKILKTTLLDHNPRTRIAAIETIMNSDSPEAYDLIYDRLKFDVDIEVKKNALVALYNISDRKILDEVIENDFEFELKNYAKEIINENEGENG